MSTDHGRESPEEAFLRVVHRVGDRLLAELDHVCRRNDIPFFVYAGTMLGAVREQGWIPWDDDIDVVMFRADFERFRAVCPQELPADVAYSDTRCHPRQLSSIARLLFLGSERQQYGRARKFQTVESRHITLDIFILDVAPRRERTRAVWRAAIRGLERLIVSRAMSVRQSLRAEKTSKPLALAAVLGSRLLPPGAWRRLHLAVCTAPGRFTDSPVVTGTNHYKPQFREIALTRADFLPARRVAFGDLEVPAPARAEQILEKMYGAGWSRPPLNAVEMQPGHLKEGVSVTIDGVWWTFDSTSVHSSPA